jgi:2-oxoisovalerate ferredoxin oxidoreductase beta subunit
VLVAMNRPSLEKFSGELKPGGLLLYNANIGDCPVPAGVRALAVPANELAKEAGGACALNTVMIGVLAALGGLDLTVEQYLEAIAQNFAGKPDFIRRNQAVFARAREWALTAG